MRAQRPVLRLRFLLLLHLSLTQVQLPGEENLHLLVVHTIMLIIVHSSVRMATWVLLSTVLMLEACPRSPSPFVVLALLPCTLTPARHGFR